MPRMSTTQRLTRSHIATIKRYCDMGEEVIVRCNGIEYGITHVYRGYYGQWMGVVFDDYVIELNKNCTIRKGLPQLNEIKQSPYVAFDAA